MNNDGEIILKIKKGILIKLNDVLNNKNIKAEIWLADYDQPEILNASKKIIQALRASGAISYAQIKKNAHNIMPPPPPSSLEIEYSPNALEEYQERLQLYQENESIIDGEEYSYLLINYTEINRRFLNDQMASVGIASPIDFNYNDQTGDGSLRGIKFNLTPGKDYKIIFDRVYKKRGVAINKLEVEAVIKSGLLPTKLSEKINEMVKDIRKKTGLTTEDLRLSGSSITLTI